MTKTHAETGRDEHDDVALAKRSLMIGSDGTDFTVLNIGTDGSLIVKTQLANAIDEGRVFAFSDQTDLNNAEVLDFVLETPGSPVEITLTEFILSDGPLDIEFYEGTTSSGGSAKTNIFNHNRIINSSETLTITQDPTVSAAGTLIGTAELGGGQGGNAFGGDTGDSGIIILDQGIKYLLRLISLAASNTITTNLDWIESS